MQALNLLKVPLLPLLPLLRLHLLFAAMFGVFPHVAVQGEVAMAEAVVIEGIGVLGAKVHASLGFDWLVLLGFFRPIQLE